MRTRRTSEIYRGQAVVVMPSSATSGPEEGAHHDTKPPTKTARLLTIATHAHGERAVNWQRQRAALHPVERGAARSPRLALGGGY